MLLTIDVGNTHTTFGVFHYEKLLADWRVSTSSRRTSDEWGYILKELITDQGIEKKYKSSGNFLCGPSRPQYPSRTI